MISYTIRINRITIKAVMDQQIKNLGIYVCLLPDYHLIL